VCDSWPRRCVLAYQEGLSSARALSGPTWVWNMMALQTIAPLTMPQPSLACFHLFWRISKLDASSTAGHQALLCDSAGQH
jgi:hypothetical protein